MSQQSYSILTNWDWSNSLPLNGFHKLFRPLIANEDPDRNCRFVHLPREYAISLANQGLCREAVEDLEKESKADPRKSGEYLKLFDDLELIVEDQIEADIQFLHTVPATLGKRPFIFHIETLNSLFIPWQKSPWELSEGELKTIIDEYRDLFARPECLFLFSHLESTCQLMRDWFNESGIQKKIFHWPLGRDLPEMSPVKEAISDNRGKRFLFTGSQHGIDHNWEERGIDLFLEFARSRQETHPEDQFTVLGNIPDCPSNVFPLGGRYLSEADFSKLLMRHDFFFIPSTTGHTISITDSWAHGCVPIMLELPLYLELGASDENSIIVRGTKPQEPSHLALQTPNRRQINKGDFLKILEERLEQLDADAYASLVEQGRNLIRDEFCPKNSYEEFERLLSASSDRKLTNSSPSSSGLGSEWEPLLVNPSAFDRRPVMQASINLGQCSIQTDGKSWCSNYAPLELKHYSPFHSSKTVLSPFRYPNTGDFTSNFQNALTAAIDYTLSRSHVSNDLRSKLSPGYIRNYLSINARKKGWIIRISHYMRDVPALQKLRLWILQRFF